MGICGPAPIPPGLVGARGPDGPVGVDGPAGVGCVGGELGLPGVTFGLALALGDPPGSVGIGDAGCDAL